MRLSTILILFPAALLHAASGTVTVTVNPAEVSLRAGADRQFTAKVANSPTQTVTWKASAGTISVTGKYQAPAAVPTPNTVTVTATASDGTTTGAATVILLNPQPVIHEVSPSTVTDNLPFTLVVKGE